MTDTGTFNARIDELRKMVGSGKLVGTVKVDQIYAHRIHEELTWRHPRGGTAKYLERPLMEHFRDYLDDYAKTVLKDGGQPAMKRSMEHLSDEVEITAPREWGDSRNQGTRPSLKTTGRSSTGRRRCTG